MGWSPIPQRRAVYALNFGRCNGQLYHTIHEKLKADHVRPLHIKNVTKEWQLNKQCTELPTRPLFLFPKGHEDAINGC